MTRFTQLGALVEEWEGERLVRKRIGVLVALRDGTPPADIPYAPAMAIANFWEKVAALARAGHMTPSLIAEGFGGVQLWWAILSPWVTKVRTEDANPAYYEHVEWLAGNLDSAPPVVGYRSTGARSNPRTAHCVERGRPPRPGGDAHMTVNLPPTPIWETATHTERRALR